MYRMYFRNDPSVGPIGSRTCQRCGNSYPMSRTECPACRATQERIDRGRGLLAERPPLGGVPEGQSRSDAIERERLRRLGFSLPSRVNGPPDWLIKSYVYISVVGTIEGALLVWIGLELDLAYVGFAGVALLLLGLLNFRLRPRPVDNVERTSEGSPSRIALNILRAIALCVLIPAALVGTALLAVLLLVIGVGAAFLGPPAVVLAYFLVMFVLTLVWAFIEATSE
jgi:hypothetical protein